MGRRLTLNAQRLTKQRVQALLAARAVLHPAYTAALNGPALAGNSVYTLPDGNLLLVHGLVGIRGKGDIWPRLLFHKSFP